MLILSKPESASDNSYMDNETMTLAHEKQSEQSTMPKTVNSDKTELQNDTESEGKNGACLPLPSFNTEISGRKNDGFVSDDQNGRNTNKLQEIKAQLANQLKHELSSEQNANGSGSICKTGSENQSAASTPKKQRSRAESKVSFSEETKVSIFKRMDSIPVEESFCQRMTSLRWQVAFMCCLIASLSITVRQCMSMAIVCMSDTKTDLMTNTSQGNSSIVTSSTETNLQWDLETQGLVLSSYYYTFPLTPLLGGYLAGKFGGKWVIFSQIMLMCAASISIPFVALIDPALVMIARAVVGFTSGGLMPATVQLLSRWAPQFERSRMLAIVNSGQSIGNILTFLLSGFICMIPFQGGWPFIFYIFTAVNFLANLLWIVVVYDSPEVHPKASAREVLYILQERRSTTAKMPSPPWKNFVTSGPFWAILVAHTTHGFIFTVIGTFLPLYMKDVLMYDPTTNGVLSSLPFIGRFIGAFSVGFLADKCTEKKWFSTGTTRKGLQCIGMLGSAPFLIALSYMTVERRTLAVVLLICYWTLQSTTNAAFRVNHLDIAPTYAGVINGITLTCASLAALVAPVVTAAITTNGTREEWQIVFFICAGLGVFGALVFCLLGSGEEQEWAKDPNLDIENDIRRMSMDVQSLAEQPNGETSGFTLGGQRRRSSQKPYVGVSSDVSINGQDIDEEDLTYSSLEKGQLSFETELKNNDFIHANNNSFSNLRPILNFHSHSEKDCRSIDDINAIGKSPVNPTLSYSSYGFENTIMDIDDDAEQEPASQLNNSIGNTTKYSDDIEETETYTSSFDRTDNTGVKNRNHKNLVMVMSKNDAVSECTHL
ncbi:Sialin [Mizuhopecten yessoensis]|uniref:Sialin n=1 Tax=Mizuhopecten yessoensis TaxID=6573 RepID=A0A210PMI9_MIZYE|nr:Sialin [Mizuhopecten yessoensis]